MVSVPCPLHAKPRGVTRQNSNLLTCVGGRCLDQVECEDWSLAGGCQTWFRAENSLALLPCRVVVAWVGEQDRYSLSVCLSVCLSVHLSVFLPACLPLSPPVHTHTRKLSLMHRQTHKHSHTLLYPFLSLTHTHISLVWNTSRSSVSLRPLLSPLSCHFCSRHDHMALFWMNKSCRPPGPLPPGPWPPGPQPPAPGPRPPAPRPPVPRPPVPWAPWILPWRVCVRETCEVRFLVPWVADHVSTIGSRERGADSEYWPKRWELWPAKTTPFISFFLPMLESRPGSQWVSALQTLFPLLFEAQTSDKMPDDRHAWRTPCEHGPYRFRVHTQFCGNGCTRQTSTVSPPHSHSKSIWLSSAFMAEVLGSCVAKQLTEQASIFITVFLSV